MNYVEFFKKSAEANRDKKALVTPNSNTRLTYGEPDDDFFAL